MTQKSVAESIKNQTGENISQNTLSYFENLSLGYYNQASLYELIKCWFERNYLKKEQRRDVGVDIRKRKTRTYFSRENLALLLEAYRQNKQPDKVTLLNLSVSTGHGVRHVKRWFTNR